MQPDKGTAGEIRSRKATDPTANRRRCLPAVRWAIKRAIERGAFVVAVAGNQGKNEVHPFGKIPKVVTVGAVYQHLEPASFSNRGP